MAKATSCKSKQKRPELSKTPPEYLGELTKKQPLTTY